MIWLPAPMRVPEPIAGGAAQDDVRLDGHVFRQLDRGVDAHAARVDHRHPGHHVGLVDGHPELELGLGQLRPVVDAVEGAVVLDHERDDRPAILARQLDQRRQVELARDRRRPHVPDPPAQPGCVEGVDAGVDLVDLELLGRRVLLLDDAQHLPAVVAANHAAQALGIEGVDADEGHHRSAGPPQVDQLRQQIRVHQGHVAGEDEHLGHVRRRDRERGPDRVRRAQWRLLEGEVGAIGEDLGDRRGRRRVDDQRPAMARVLRRVQHVGQHGAAAQLVEDLGLARLHARPETGGEHHRQGALRRLAHGIGR